MSVTHQIADYLGDLPDPGWATVKEISDALDITPANTRRALRELHSKRLVDRETVPHTHCHRYRGVRASLLALLTERMEQITGSRVSGLGWPGTGE